jgi:hypothetical protein
MWSLGMILYKMVFFSLPFKHAQDNEIEELEREILQYPGYVVDFIHKIELVLMKSQIQRNT